MLKIAEVTSREHLTKLRAKEDKKFDYFYICKYSGEMFLSDNGVLKTLSGVPEEVLADYEKAVDYMHEHKNKAVLDKITAIESEVNESSNNPVSSAAVAKAMAQVHHISKGVLSAPGWYRIAEHNGSMTGFHSNEFTATIKRSSVTDSGEHHTLQINSVATKGQTIQSINSYSHTHLITKARYTYDSTNAYLEIYYDRNGANNVFIELDDALNHGSSWKAIVPVLTQETVSGVIVTTTYDIPANVKIATDADIQEVIKNIPESNTDALTLGGHSVDYFANKEKLDTHEANTSNPHSVTKSQVGLGNVPNVTTNDQTPTYTVASANAELTSGEKMDTAFGKIAKAIKSLISHLADTVSHVTSTEKTSWNNKADKAVASTSADGLMSKDDKSKLEGIASGANKYSHPNSGVTAGTYRSVTVNAQGHVTEGTNPTLSVDQGGTGTTTAKGAANKFIKALDAGTDAITENSNFVVQGEGDYTDIYYLKPLSMLWTFIKGKADSVYAKSSHGNHIPSGGSSGQILRWSSSGTATWGADNNNTYGVVSTTADGLAPKRDGSTTKFLRGDGTWAVPPDNNTTYSNMTAASASAAGKAGLVPAPAAGKQTSFLRGDGTWVVPTNTTYSNFVKSGSTAAAGLVPAPPTTAGTSKYLREDGTWAEPASTSGMSDTYKNKVDNTNITYVEYTGTSYTMALTVSNFSVVKGARLVIKRTNNMTSYASYNLTLNVNSSGAKNVLNNSGNGVLAREFCRSGETLDLTYNGTAWIRTNIPTSILPFSSGSAPGYLVWQNCLDYGNSTIPMISNGNYYSAFPFVYSYNLTVAGTCSYSAIIGGCDNSLGGWYNGVAMLGGYSSQMLASYGAIISGYQNQVSGEYASTIGGRNINANNIAEVAIGKYSTAGTSGGGLTTQTGDVFKVGNGTHTSKLSNAFRITYDGSVYGTKAYNSSGADYAEFIYEWNDLNVDKEDRVGYFVTIKDKKIQKATSNDYIAGIISGNPSIVGNADENYYWMYERDEFNRIVWEDSEVEEYVYDEETGEPLFNEQDEWVTTTRILPNSQMKLNENYNARLAYIPRKDRPEWDYVGMLGVLPVRDDGTCIEGQYCKCNDEGIATLANTEEIITNRFTYLVTERVTDNVVKVIMK